MLNTNIVNNFQATMTADEPNRSRSLVEHDMETEILSVDWNDSGDTLAIGHGLGVTIYDPIDQTKSYQHLGLEVNHVRLRGDHVAAVHPNHTISYLNLNTSEIVTLGGSRGHDSFVNAVDISPEGLVASVGDDRTVLVWEGLQPRSFRLAAPGLAVRFWDDSDSDRLVVLEQGDKVRILDWRKGTWLLTVFPGKPVKAIGVHNGDLVVVGDGWWNKYNIPSLSGGCGYTPPTDSAQIISSNRGSDSVYVTAGDFIAHASTREVNLYDLETPSEHGISAQCDVSEVRALALHPQGNALAVASNHSLFILNTPQSEVILHGI
ncbi:hypothetical protein TRVA0_011S01838 [Trichomonascus vanleenenianus]|uniref:WD40 repeat domain-containing protein n=1 Tax=Trichomonascus vanleenenianus TaxID=2268995 RepID=UPI003ECA214D